MTEVFAHRGCTDGFEENTLAAFRAAADRGADGVELDVRRTADGALVVHHDAALADGRVIWETARAALPASVPDLAEALAACGSMRVNVEIKNSPNDAGFEPDRAIAHDTARLISDGGWSDRVIVSSFDRASLDHLAAEGAPFPLGWLLELVVNPADHLGPAAAAGFAAVHPFVTWVDAALVDAAHAHGLAVNTWTVNARHDLERLVALGVDAVITDRLDEALDVVRRAATIG